MMLSKIAPVIAGIAAGAVGAELLRTPPPAVYTSYTCRDVVHEELSSLSDYTAQLQSDHQEIQEEMADMRFMMGHTSLQLSRALGEFPTYDIDTFLQRNPRAKKYFPYLLNAVNKYREKWPVDPMFALAILKQETDFGRFIVSKAGALGDAQFIESTARRYGLDVQEPGDWKRGRQYYSRARESWSSARNERNRFLAHMAPYLSPETRASRDQARHAFDRYVDELRGYYRFNQVAQHHYATAEEAFEIYSRTIDAAVRKVEAIERETRHRLRREADLLEASGLRYPKTLDEIDTEVRLVINDHLAQVDPRLSPILAVDALVRHLADLFYEFKGDERLVAARYNASRQSMEAAVADLGGVGIPRFSETQDYVNRVHVLQALLAMDAGVVIDPLMSCCTEARVASRD